MSFDSEAIQAISALVGAIASLVWALRRRRG